MQDDRAYFYQRAEAEVIMAQKAASPQAVHAHYYLAGVYLDRAYGDDPGEPATSEQVRSHLANEGIDAASLVYPIRDEEGKTRSGKSRSLR